MLNELLILAFLVIAVEAITEIIVASTLFQPIRNFIAKKASSSRIAGFFAKLTQCGYCASVWIAFLLAWIIQIDIINFFISWVVFTFVLHRLSNFWHEFLSRWFNRHPIIMSINLFKTGDNDGAGPEVESEVRSEEDNNY